MSVVDLLPLTVAIPLVGAALLALSGHWIRRMGCDILTALFATAQAAVLLVLWLHTAHGSPGHSPASWVGGWTPHRGESVGIVLVGDPVGVGAALLAALLVLAVVAYSWRYFDEPPARMPGTFPALVLLFEAGMCGFAVTGDLFDAFVFFELMGTAAYALTGYRVEDPRPVQGALTFGLVNSLGAYCSLLGIGLLYARTGELGMAQIGHALGAHRTDLLTVAAFVLVLTGLLVKAAVVPFHFWLADAHAVAPTPVCMLLSGVMVELGVYGAARVYWTVFSGAGGIPAPAVRGVLVCLGVVTALLGAVMCWQQRHLKRLLAFSTIGHVGLFLVAAALLDPEGAAGFALYVAGHAGAKAALFALTGVLLDQYGSVDVHGLFGRAKALRRSVGLLFVAGGLALAGLPPFGTGLGKSFAEHAAGSWLPVLTALFVVVSGVTGGAVLRAALRMFAGAGRRPGESGGPQTSGEGEEPEVRDPGRRVPRTMIAVPAVLLAACLALGLAPGVGGVFGRAGALFVSRADYQAAAGLPGPGATAPPPPLPDWTTAGVALGLLSTALAVGLAAVAVWGPARRGATARAARRALAACSRTLVLPLRGLHSGRLGDDVAWLGAGVAALLGAFSLLR
ncbi:complex I subunit 5 family protein [Streptacidiphilus neutrinimicus]|uniref:complex I subunit 5 family protein n=1 Tax=Streptacidiphilus neutrinimicus TaxID=105420 RepID=UPI0005A83944|nr:complex I subunit 5 family protein [Streptacidiphilus neutrinimicus]